MRRRHVLRLLWVQVLVCLVYVGTAFAGGGGLTGGATEATQMLNHSELVTQISQLSTQISNQIRMIQDMVLNTITIPDQLFRDVKQVYGSVRDIIGKTQGIAYNLSNIDDELKRRFKSYTDLTKVVDVEDFSTEYRNVVDTQMETVRTTMEAIGVSWEELVKDDASALKELQSKASSATGRNELIQATNQLLGFLAEDAMKLRQLQMMQSQMAGAAYEAERTKSDLSNRRLEEFFKRGDETDVKIPETSLIDNF